MTFCPDKTEVFFSFLENPVTVSSIFCQIDLPFMSSPITIRWYGVIIAFGLILAVLFGGRKAYVWKMDINKMLDVLIYGALGGVVGARLYYVFSKWDYYSACPEEIFQIWHGGLAIYGGLIGGILAALIVCKVEKLNILNLLDLCGMSFLIGQGIGRWGNFANQEAFGTNTDSFIGMYSVKTEAYLTSLVNSGTDIIVDPSKPVHPTFLYESLWCLLSFVILYIVCQKFRKFSGQLFLGYGFLYGIERAVVEGMRTDSLYIGDTNIRVSQLLSLILVIVCGTLLVIFTIKYTKNPKPIEGVDYFNEIPLYRHRKKAADMKALVEKYTEELTVLKAKADADVENKPDKRKIASLEEKLRKAQNELNTAEEKVAIQDAKKAAKAAKKAK
ncbi:MAG: prolipoprotein diacylglyceryl transferase [Clostridia bacterium]|nr:prolipoprotein diacylglyceryl transferase [Clostridia bacterium]